MIRTSRTTQKYRSTAMVVALLTLFLGEWFATAQTPGSPPSPPVVVPAYRQANSVAVITIEGMIDGITRRSIDRRIKLAEAAGADAIVFKIDTFGGSAAAALEICEAIKMCPIPNTVAWVYPKAISAGAIMALACREIVVSPTATMGDCAPILPVGIPLGITERAKIESPLLAEVVDSARRNGYDEKLVMSFIAMDIELWLVENIQTGDRLFVDRAEYGLLFEGDPPETARMQAAGKTGRVVPFTSKTPGQDETDETIEKMPGTPESDQTRLLEIEMQQEFTSQRPILSGTDRGTYRLLGPVVDSQTLLTIKAQKTVEWGLAKQVMSNDADLSAYFGSTTVTYYDMSWSERFVQLLTSMPVRAVLLLIVFIGILWEMATPGLGVPITIALGAGVILLGAPALAGMAQWWDIAFILLGLVLIALEVFVIPGFGVAGIAGILCLGAGFIGTFVAPDPNGGFLPATEEARRSVLWGLSVFLFGLFGMMVTVFLGAKHLSSMPGANRLILSGSVADFEGPDGGGSVLEAMNPSTTNHPKIGDVGTVVTTLRPVGRAQFGNDIFEVISGCGIIEANEQVLVKEIEGFRILVEVDRHG